MTDAKKPWEQQFDGGASGAGAEPWKQDYGPDAADAPAAPRGLKGWGRDIAATAVKGAIAVPEALVGLADIPTGGRVGKFLENEGGAVGFRPKQAKEQVNEWHSDATKEAQRKFQEADGVLDKTAVALQNPSLIATSVGESLPSMGLGGVAARGLMAATKLGQMGAKGAVLAGAAGEGATMAGSQAEQIRQETNDGLLNPTQAGLAVATGLAGGAFGVAGGKVAQRLGIGDADTMLAQGIKGVDEQIAGTAARAAANPLVADAAVKSIPRKVIEGAIAEGFLEELPQSMAEQIFQNIALDKPWHEDLDSAAVMGVLSGGAMGAGAAGFKGFRESGAKPADGTAPGEAGQPEQGGPTPGGDMVRNALNESLLMLPAPVIDVGSDGVARTAADRNARLQRLATGDVTDITPVAPAPTPSEAMGLRSGPDAGSLENAAALAVDTGATAQVQQEAALAQAAEAAKKAKPANQKQEQPAQAQQDIDPQTGEISGVSGLAGWSDVDLSTAFRNAQSKEVRLELATELSRRRAAREEDALQAELRDEQAADNMPDVPDSAFARTQEDAGPAPKNIEIQGAQQQAAPGSQAEGANVATLAQLNRKKLAEMSDDELQQLSALLTADHSRQQKIQKAIQARAAQAQTAINEGAKTDGTQTPKAQQGGAQPAQAGAAQASAPATQSAAQGVATNATPAQQDGAQAPVAPSAKSQAASPQAAPAKQVSAAKSIAMEGNAQREQERQRQLDASERWTRMTTVERQAVVGNAPGLNAIARKNLHTRAWADIGEKTRAKLVESLVNPTAGNAAQAPEAIKSEAKTTAEAAASQTPVKQEAQPMADAKPFAPESGTLGISRADMPQVPTANHGGLVKHLNAQGIAHETKSVDAADLKPTQAEYSPAKVEAAKSAAGDRAVIVSSDGHIIDGHHQAVAAAEQGKQVKAIVLDAPVEQALAAVKASPSANVEHAPKEVQAPVADGSQADPTSSADPKTLSMEQRDLGRQPMTDVAAIQLATGTEASTIAVTNGIAKFRQGKHNGGHGFGEEYGSFDYLPQNRFTGSQFRISFNSLGQYQVIEFLRDETEKTSTGKFDKANWRADAIRIINEATGKASPSESLMQAAKDSGKLEVVHVGDKPAKAEAKSAPEADKDGNTIVGRRKDGVMIRQDKRGVRWYAEGGVRIQETVSMRPTAEGMKVARGELKPDFMTAEESAADTAEKSTKALADKAPEATKKEAEKPANYGSKNKLVSQSRADELRAKLREKAKNNMFGGLDTEMMAWGTELAVFHLEAGVRKFSDLVAAMASDLGTTPAKLKPYLRSWYNGARDMMEDHGLSIEGMDSPETVRAELAKIGTEAAPDSEAKTSAPSLSESLLSAIRAGNMPKDNPALKKLVEAFDGKPADPARMKEAQEQLEAAIVAASREVVAKSEGDKATFDALLRLYESQPNLNVRTSTSIANQAYSTPAPLAFIASQLAGITKQTLTHEPTAGTGMLLIGADPKNSVVNELNDLRVSLLEQQGFTPTQKDAATAPLRDKRGPVDAVITNPPFGSVKDDSGKATKVKVDGYNLGQIDHLIAARALETMKDDGRAVLILGANKAPGGLSTDDRIFFNWLYSHYNVVGHFEVAGDLYARQGAGWPVRVITIAGREKSARISPVAGTIERVDNWSQVYDQYKQLLDSSGRPVRSAGAAAGRPVAGQAQPADVPSAAGPEAAKSDRPGRTERAGGNGNVTGARAGAVADLTGATTDPVGHEPDEQRLNAQSFVPPRLDATGQGAKPVPAKRPAKPAGTAAVADAPAEAGNEFQTKYIPRSARKDEGVLIPSNMAQPTQDALNHLEDQVGDIDDFARKELGYDSTKALHNALMGLQVDSVATAIHQIKQGKAVVIADQTGIGKGRQAASIIRWAARNGMTPVFVSVKPSLFTDMYGDLADIGTHDVDPFIMNADAWVSGQDGEKLFANKAGTHRAAIEAIANNGALPAGRNALFMTYSQINTDNAQRRALRALAGNAVFVLDESHNAAGASGTGEFMISVLKEAKGVTYLSATYAKRPDNMPLYFKTDIGDAAADSEGLANAMSAGGLPLQTVVSNNLVKAGQMFRRERSYDGVSIASTFDRKNRALHEEMSDTATQALRAIVRADRLFHEIYVKQLQKQLKKEGGDLKDIAGNQASAGVQHTEFSSVVHNFVRQMLLGLKAQTAADEAIASLKRGEKPIIAVENTMGSFLSEYASSNGLSQGDSLGSFDYRTVLSRALERSRALVETLPTGEEVRKTISLAQLDPITRKAYDQAQEVIDGLKIAIPVSPIDWMRAEIERAGFSVAEITGRNLAVDYSNKGEPVLSAIEQSEQRDKVATTRRFNGGELDALILNVAGSTGISLHASEKFQDQRQRHMIVAQAAGDINIFMQMLGRIHRTGQVRLPKYTILSVDLPTEKRPTAVLSKKMKSLNANTSSNTESATSVKTADILNKYGDQIVHQYLQDNMELARQLDVDDIVGGDTPAEDIARKATGRLALQPIEVQNSFYEDVEAQYDALIEYLNKTNQNDLEPRTFDFDAKETRSEVLFDGPNKETPFGADAIYGEYSIKAQGSPMTPDEIKAAIESNLGGKTGAEHADALADQMLQTYAEQFNQAREKAGTTPDTFAIDKYTALMKSAFGDVGVNMAEEAQALIAKGMPLPAMTPRDMMRAQGVGTGMDFIKSHAIGRTFRVDINSEPFNAVVTNVRNTHKATGNPFSMSKLQLTVSVNGALRSITVPATQFKKIEVSSIAPTFRVEQLFKEQPPNQRETAKIITGNLLAAYGELKGVNGTIISFTTADGGTEQGILLPKLFDYAKNTQGDYRLRSGAEALNFLQRSENKDIGRFGIATRDGLVRVLPYGDGVQVRVPRSKAQGARYFLDKNLIAIAGDFVSTANAMAAKVENADDAVKLLDLLMDKQALYALPSMAEEAKALAPKDAPAEDSANYEGAAQRRPASAQDKAVMQAIAEGKSARDVLRVVASGSKDPFLRQVARLLLKSGITPNIEFGHIGKTDKGNPIHGQYRGKTDTIAIAGSAEYAAERIFMHEAMHAATMRALAKPGLARLQLQKLLEHVRKQPGAAGFYGISDKDGNVDEFVAEVFTNPDFQAALRQMKAPSDSSTIKTAWDSFVRILRNILGLKNDPNNVLSQALQLGVAAMREDMGLRKQGMRGAGRANAGADTIDQTDTAAFKRWFGDSKVVDADGKPLVVYHGTASEFYAFDQDAEPYNYESDRGKQFFIDSKDAAKRYAENTADEFGGDARVLPVYLKIENPKVIEVSGRPDTWWDAQPDYFWEMDVAGAGHDGLIVKGDGGVMYVTTRPTQIKSATGNNGNFDPEDPDIRNFGMDDATAAAKNIGQGIKAMTATNIKKAGKHKLTDWLALGLQFLGRRQLVDVYGNILPMAEYDRLAAQMEADKNDVGASADDLARRWGKLTDEGKLAELMHDATLAQIDADASVDAVDGDDRAQSAMLKARFKSLSPEAQKVYQEARDSYKEHHAQVRQAIKERIQRSELSSQKRQELLKKMDDDFFQKVKGVYFPLARFGQYVVAVKDADGKVVSVSRAETMPEADAMREEMRKAFPSAQGYNVGRVTLSKDFVANHQMVGRGFVSDLYAALEKMDVPHEQLAELEDTIGQLYLSSLPDLSWAKHGIHRKGTPGFSQDARRAFAQNTFHGARYLAKLRYGDLMQDELDGMQKHVNEWSEVDDFDQPKAQRVVNEMMKRHDALMNPVSNPVSTALTSFGFIYYLGLSPAAAIVNLSQTALVAYPVMAGKWGYKKSAEALMKASAETVAGKNDLRSQLKDADEIAAYDEAVRTGAIDVTQAHDLAGIAQGEDAKVMWKMRPVMRAASFLFHHAERFNRQATFIAAYRLARAAGTKHVDAYEQAVKATYDGHYDYSSGNRPRVMQGNVARVVLLFKQFAQNMIFTLGRQAYQSVAGESPEIRKEARKVFAGLITMHAAAAGVLGLPLVGPLLAVASALGGDDDEPWDAEVALRNMLAETFGNQASEVIAKGFSRLTPWDASGRVGLDNLIFPDVQEGLEGQRWAEQFATGMLGPVVGIGVNAAKAAQKMADGDYGRALEDLLPVAMRNPIKAGRYMMEGAQDRSGIAIKDEVSAAGSLGQLIGFSPSEVRLAFEGRKAIVDADRRLNERRSELLGKFAKAVMSQDQEGVSEARQEIAKFNEKNVGRRITYPQMTQSVRARQRRIDQAEDGVYLPRNRREAMEAGQFAFGS